MCSHQDALDIAVAEERASLVTVLRFIRINEASDPTSKSCEPIYFLFSNFRFLFVPKLAVLLSFRRTGENSYCMIIAQIHCTVLKRSDPYFG